MVDSSPRCAIYTLAPFTSSMLFIRWRLLVHPCYLYAGAFHLICVITLNNTGLRCRLLPHPCHLYHLLLHLNSELIPSFDSYLAPCAIGLLPIITYNFAIGLLHIRIRLLRRLAPPRPQPPGRPQQQQQQQPLRSVDQAGRPMCEGL